MQFPPDRCRIMGRITRAMRGRRVASRAVVLTLVTAATAGCFGAKHESGAIQPAQPTVQRLDAPVLPSTMYSYAASADSAVARLTVRGPGGPGIPGGRGDGRGARGGRDGDGGFDGRGRGGGGRGFGRAFDNTPVSNPTTDAGATLGRVLFYDRHLSANDQVACASCHIQRFGFADTARLSRGFAGGRTRRHSMALANARLYANGRFFWDERARTLEAQVLMPVQDSVEMGMTLPALEAKLGEVAYYRPLFQAAFGTPEITSDRIARALAQFVRAMVSADARFDRSVTDGKTMNEEEQQGLRLFNGLALCGTCHVSRSLSGDGVHNTGLDVAVTDSGAGRGRFKVPSLRNVAVRAPYMHDGRFATLEQVVDHYSDGVQANPALDQRLRRRDGAPRALGLSAAQKKALVAYLKTLTDSAFLTAPRFSDPFVLQSSRPRQAH